MSMAKLFKKQYTNITQVSRRIGQVDHKTHITLVFKRGN